MNSRRPQEATNNDALESAISAALEQQSAPAIPVDFAARVATKASTIPLKSRAPRARYARTICLALSALLVVLLFVLAPHAQPSFSSFSFDIELSVVALLGVLLYWLTQTRGESV